MFDLAARISAFDILGRFLSQYREKRKDKDLEKLNKFFLDEYRQVIVDAGVYNNWFTPGNVEFALQQWSEALSPEKLVGWTQRYPQDFFQGQGGETIAIIMAGNLPLVGFHDLLSVLMSGHSALIKPSSDDQKLLPFIAQVLVAIDRRFASRITFADGKMENFDAIIATGSDNSARYFEYYFGKYPHIIRKNRTSIAILNGEETEDDLLKLGEDTFRYFGLGCRNVSKLYLPRNFDLDRIFKAFYNFREVIENKKYGNNYDYNRAVFMMEKIPFLENGFVILRENEQLHAPAAVIHYEYYDDLEALSEEITKIRDELQCIVGYENIKDASVPFGRTQMPELYDYADNVDTIEFLYRV